MKVSGSIRRLYEDQLEKNTRLKAEVDRLVFSIKDARWHYESRIKQLQSFALKVESGRIADPKALDDFFACSLVVANFSQLSDAEKLISDNFEVVLRRPESAEKTHKSPSDFPFDDLRLYIRLREDSSRPPSDLPALLFELQIKTFLQHAWTIATHDLVYKTDDVNWSKERIAYQTKAMLEHAEVSIQEAENLSRCTALAKEDDETTQMRSAISLLRRHWSADELPKDIRRLAQNLLSLFWLLRSDIKRLEVILDEGKTARGGTHPTNLSPFGTVIQYLLMTERDAITRLLAQDFTKIRRKPVHILLPAEVEIPPDIDQTKWRNAVRVG